MVRKTIGATICRAALACMLLMGPMFAATANDSEPSRAVNPYEGKKEVVPEGASLLNQYCSHCHGPNAVQGERMRDLRRLNLRYGNDMADAFWTTVQKGRMDKGMPVWGGVLSDDVVWKIYTFLQSIQSEE